jgi:hypothetical protein
MDFFDDDPDDIHFRDLNRVPNNKFIEIMDIAFAIRETKIEIDKNQADIVKVDQDINDLKSQLKISDQETKKQLSAQMKHLGSLKKENERMIVELYNSLNNREGTGLRNKLMKASNKSSEFVDYVVGMAFNDPVTINKFREAIKTSIRNIGQSERKSPYNYLSIYGKAVDTDARRTIRGRQIFTALNGMPSFQSRNSVNVNALFQNPYANEAVLSYLGKPPPKSKQNNNTLGGTRCQKTNKNKRKQKTRRNKNYTS